MKFLFRWAFRLALVMVALTVVLVLLKDVLLRVVMENRLRAAIGLEVRIGRLELRSAPLRLTLENLQLDNTPEFGGSLFLDIPELHLEGSLPGWDPRQMGLKLVRLHLAEVNLVESQDGRTNLVEVLSRWRGASAVDRSRQQTPIGLPITKIDVLNLTVGRLNYVNLRAPDRSGVFEVGIKNEILTDVHSFAQIEARLLQVLLRRGISLARGDRGFRLDSILKLTQPATANATLSASSTNQSLR